MRRRGGIKRNVAEIIEPIFSGKLMKLDFDGYESFDTKLADDKSGEAKYPDSFFSFMEGIKSDFLDIVDASAKFTQKIVYTPFAGFAKGEVNKDMLTKKDDLDCVATSADSNENKPVPKWKKVNSVENESNDAIRMRCPSQWCDKENVQNSKNIAKVKAAKSGGLKVGELVSISKLKTLSNLNTFQAKDPAELLIIGNKRMVLVRPHKNVVPKSDTTGTAAVVETGIVSWSQCLVEIESFALNFDKDQGILVGRLDITSFADNSDSNTVKRIVFSNVSECTEALQIIQSRMLQLQGKKEAPSDEGAIVDQDSDRLDNGKINNDKTPHKSPFKRLVSMFSKRGEHEVENPVTPHGFRYLTGSDRLPLKRLKTEHEEGVAMDESNEEQFSIPEAVANSIVPMPNESVIPAPSAADEGELQDLKDKSTVKPGAILAPTEELKNEEGLLQAPVNEAIKDEAVPQIDPLLKYTKMLANGVPLEAIKHKMIMERVDSAKQQEFMQNATPKVVQKDIEAPLAASLKIDTRPAQIEVPVEVQVDNGGAVDEAMKKYKLMLKAGIPAHQVRQKMINDSISGDKIVLLLGEEPATAKPSIAANLGAMLLNKQKQKEVEPKSPVQTGPKLLNLHLEAISDCDIATNSVWNNMSPIRGDSSPVPTRTLSGGKKESRLAYLKDCEFSKLASLFTRKTANALKSVTKDDKKMKPGGLVFMDNTRCMNLSIGLASLKSLNLSVETLLEGVEAMNFSLINLDICLKLKEMMPSEAELKTYSHMSQVNLKKLTAEAELFMHKMCQIKNIKQKVNSLLFLSQYSSRNIELSKDIEKLSIFTNKLKESIGLKEVMRCVLAIGNVMNASSAEKAYNTRSAPSSQGTIRAFKMNSLLKLSQTKSSDGSCTVMDYIVQLLRDRSQQELSEGKENTKSMLAYAIDIELEMCQACSKININEIRSEIKGYSNDLENAKALLMQCDAQSSIALQEKVNEIECQHISILQLLNECVKSCTETCIYFNEDANTVTVLFEVLSAFLRNFSNVKEKIVHKEKKNIIKMEELQKLGLISKVCSELDMHLGFSDKTLAEYIIFLASQHNSSASFQKALAENGADFPLVFADSIYKMIKKSEIKASMKETKVVTAAKPLVRNNKDIMYPGLAVPDTVPVPLEDMISEQPDDSIPESKLEDRPAVKREHVRGDGDCHRDGRDRDRDRDHKHNDYDRSRDRDSHHDRDRDRDDRRRSDERDRDRERDHGRSHRDDRERDHGRSHRDDRERDHDRSHRDDRERDRDRDRDHDRRRRDDRDGDYDYDRKRKIPESKELSVNAIYSGKITNILDFGCFVEFYCGRDRKEGLVHIGQVSSYGQVKDLKSFVRRGQTVLVKVLSIAGTKISLSMKEVDQDTGEDLFPERGRESAKLQSSNESSIKPKKADLGVDVSRIISNENQSRTRPKKKYTPQELFEIQQLINSGVLPVSEYPTFDGDEGGSGLLQEAEVEEDVDIDINENEPSFLKGQTKFAKEAEPVKIVQNLDGSLQRAALHQSQLAKERKEVKNAQNNSLIESGPKDLSKPWEDPMPELGERHFAQELRNISVSSANQVPEWKIKTQGKSLSYGKISSGSIKDQRDSLPIYRLKNELCKAIAQNQVLVVIGETGSGKTTQMTQYMAEMGYADKGIIGCTQPRRVAAMSIAKRVAEEYGCQLGEQVGYTIRFEDCTSPSTRIKYMTDGMLMREYLADNMLTKYIALMLDEAHERTVHTDVLFGLLKKLLKQRQDLKLIVTSATLDAEKFSHYFMDCPIFTIPGRTFPVEILYCKEPEPDYLEAALITVMQIHLSEPAGDILVFLTGQEEIDTCAEILYGRMKALGDLAPELIILPVYSALPSEIQSKIFEPAPKGSRKCILATNIAEASLTIDGIFYVVDPGFCKQKVYNPKLGMDSLVVCPISAASARQRAGRAGRTGPGKCYRLYTEAAYSNEMIPTSIPEIQRTNLGNVVLQLKAMGINDLLGFDFMDPPPVPTLITALESLYALSALDDEGLLTRLGRKMAEFPLDPPLSKMLILSAELGCSDEILTVVAMLSVETPFFRPKDKATQADQKRAKFNQAEGDHLTMLVVYEAWKNSRFSNPWCAENFIQARAMRRAQDVRKQLVTILDRYRMPITSCGKKYNLVCKCIVAGFFKNAAKRDPQEGYKTIADNQPVFIHPSSALFNKSPEWVVYHELVLTSKEYMRNVLVIEPKWLVELAPNFFQTSDPKKLSRNKKNERIEPLHNKHMPKDSWRLSTRQG